jgi:PKD repeat protein
LCCGIVLSGCFLVSNTPPTAVVNATPQQGAVPLNVSLSASASFDPDGSITHYAWNYGDGWTGEGATALHTYTMPGTYTVTLAVTDDKGDVSHATLSILVEAVDTFDRLFFWESHGADWQWEIAIPKTLFWQYRNQTYRPPYTSGDWHKYVVDPDDDAYIETLSANLLNAVSSYYSDSTSLYYGFLQFALQFVEAAIPYRFDTNDWAMDEWPRYPVETLVEGMGDCEDTAILFSSIVRPYVQDVHLIILPGHCAAAVPVDWAYIEQANFSIGYYQYNGLYYVMVETTGDPPDGWRIGELPPTVAADWAAGQILFFDVGRQVSAAAVPKVHHPN